MPLKTTSFLPVFCLKKLVISFNCVSLCAEQYVFQCFRLFEIIQVSLNMCADLEIWTAETNGDEDKQGGDSREEGDGGGGGADGWDRIQERGNERRWGSWTNEGNERGERCARRFEGERGGRTGEEGDGEETNVRKWEETRKRREGRRSEERRGDKVIEFLSLHFSAPPPPTSSLTWSFPEQRSVLC